MQTACPTQGGMPITVVGSNFVQTGVEVSVEGVVCTNPIVQASGTQIVCTLPEGDGLNVPVHVDSAGVSAVTKNFVSYGTMIELLPASSHSLICVGCVLHSAAPSISSIVSSACTASGNSVVNCPRTGAATVTLNGANFGRLPPIILVGNQFATGVVSDPSTPHQKVSFTLPPGTGANKHVVVVQNDGTIGITTYIISYAPCLPGTYVSGLVCQPCATGQFSNTNDAPQCQNCNVATIPKPDASGCNVCPAGTHNDKAGATVCTACKKHDPHSPRESRCLNSTHSTCRAVSCRAFVRVRV